jgi:hypothetical protein
MRKHAVEPGEPVTQPLGEPVTEPIARPVPAPVAPAQPAPAPAPVKEERAGWHSHVALGVVLVVAAVGMIRIGLYHWREGAVLIGGALVLAGLFRAVFPSRAVGLLAVRGRVIDVLSYAGLAALILFVAITLTGGPFG